MAVVSGLEDGSSTSSDEGEFNERGEGEEAKEEIVDYKKKAVAGSFLPAMALLDLKKVSVEEPIDTN